LSTTVMIIVKSQSDNSKCFKVNCQNKEAEQMQLKSFVVL